MRGELVTAPRLRNPRIPKAVNDIVLKAMTPEVSHRYQRAGEVLDDILAFRDARKTPRPTPAPSEAAATPALEEVDDIQLRLRAREAPQARFCWHCRKPLHARSSKCPFCGETQ